MSEMEWLRSLQWWSDSLHWAPFAAQRLQFQKLYKELVKLNQEVNLTRITSPEEFLEKHLWDSLWGIQPWLVSTQPSECSVIDIGTGGGFPGCPVAIAQPTWQVTLLDATRKKVACLEQLCEHLGLANVKLVSDRAENLGQHPQYRAQFDLALIRAVDIAPVCAEYAIPFLQLQGIAVLYRGQWTQAEEQQLDTALQSLGGQIQEVRVTHTPLSNSIRHCIVIQKQMPTPKDYPRRSGVPSRRPLG
jgi:16S rRNA (guanine527-N7)-methyltransferase